jgi:hypothetical protein
MDEENVFSFAALYMKMKDIMLGKINQTQKDKYYIISYKYRY